MLLTVGNALTVISPFLIKLLNSRGSKAFSGVCVCLSVRTDDKTKTAENKITKLGTWIVHNVA